MTETVEVTSAASADEKTAKVEETAAETVKAPVAASAKSLPVAPSVKAASDLLYGMLDPLAL